MYMTLYVLNFFSSRNQSTKAANSEISQGNYQILPYMVLSFISSVIL